MMRHLIAMFVVLLPMLTSAAPPTAQVRARLNYDALHAGQQAAIAVVASIPNGLHAQSHTPTDASFVAFTLTLADERHITALPPVYPTGERRNYPSLGELDVYTGLVRVYVPFTVKGDAAVGPIKMEGTLRLQMCDDKTCFQPVKVPFAVETQIVPANVAIHLTNAEEFAGLDPRVFAAGASSMPAPLSIQFFGWSFALPANAYLLAFGLALAVGVLFNLMPCVLPVLPLKALGFYEASQHNRGRCFALGVVFSLGMLAMFALLAVLVVVQQQAWGQLFSRGWFVWSIVAVLVAMALGQLGVFAVLLPNRLYNFVPTHSTWTGNFVFGGFTAILSTPCTAPMFVGLLLWSAAQPKWVGVAAVMMVGLGMALPYLVLAAFPQLARKMPRASGWSELLKQFMGFILLAVAAWFAAGRILPGNAYLWIIFAIVAVASVFLVVRTKMLGGTKRGLSVAAGIGLVLTGGTLAYAVRAASELIPWQAYSQQAFDAAIKSGRPVMLEFTANWCANCKELESRVFSDKRAAEAISAAGAIPIRADLTFESAPGWEMLLRINASGGIPLTVIYPRGGGEPIQLSSIYTTANLVAALDRAAKPKQ